MRGFFSALYLAILLKFKISTFFPYFFGKKLIKLTCNKRVIRFMVKGGANSET